jgi:hypothetical protein
MLVHPRTQSVPQRGAIVGNAVGAGVDAVAGAVRSGWRGVGNFFDVLEAPRGGGAALTRARGVGCVSSGVELDALLSAVRCHVEAAAAEQQRATGSCAGVCR